MAKKGSGEMPCTACMGAGGWWEAEGGNGAGTGGRSRQVGVSRMSCSGTGHL
jgi:hypothetical protein